MKKKPIDIHPLDFGLLLKFDPEPENVTIKKGGKFKTELVEYNGRVFRQVVQEPKWKTQHRIDTLKDYLKIAETQLKARK